MKLTINNKDYNIPENIEQLTWRQFRNLTTLVDKSYSGVLAALLNITVEELNNMNMEEMVTEDGKFSMIDLLSTIKWLDNYNFTTLDLLRVTETDKIELNGVDLDLNYSKNAIFGQLITILEIMGKEKDYYKVREDILNMFIGYQLAKVEKWKEPVDYRDLFVDLPLKKLYPISSFFLTKLKSQMESGKTFKKLDRDQILKTFKQVWKNLTSLAFGRQ